RWSTIHGRFSSSTRSTSARLAPRGTVNRGAPPHGPPSRQRRALADHRTSTSTATSPKADDVSYQVGRRCRLRLPHSAVGSPKRWSSPVISTARRTGAGGGRTTSAQPSAVNARWVATRSRNPCESTNSTAERSRTTVAGLCSHSDSTIARTRATADMSRSPVSTIRVTSGSRTTSATPCSNSYGPERAPLARVISPPLRLLASTTRQVRYVDRETEYTLNLFENDTHA